jgi:hypothetical protein
MRTPVLNPLFLSRFHCVLYWLMRIFLLLAMICSSRFVRLECLLVCITSNNNISELPQEPSRISQHTDTGLGVNIFS